MFRKNRGDERCVRRETNEKQNGVIGRRTNKSEPENEGMLMLVKVKRISENKGSYVIVPHRSLKQKMKQNKIKNILT